MLNGCGNVSSSSIKCLNQVVFEDAAKFSSFLRAELTAKQHGYQLTTQWKNRAKFLKLFRSLEQRLVFDHVLSYVTLQLLISLAILLVRAGLELNTGPAVPPGPSHPGPHCFQIISQNCRGLTDRSRLASILRRIYPISKRTLNARTVACLQ